MLGGMRISCGSGLGDVMGLLNLFCSLRPKNYALDTQNHPGALLKIFVTHEDFGGILITWGRDRKVKPHFSRSCIVNYETF